MKIETQELREVAAAETPRLDLYSGIHKALRALMADTLLAVGRMDPADEQDVGQASARVAELLAMCHSHLEHENEFVHRAMEARAPGSTAQAERDHRGHLKSLAELTQAVEALRLAPAAQRAGIAQALYRQLALFVAENFEHMNVEETAHNAVLWARYTDAELQGIHDALVASIPPQEMMLVMRWMVPQLNPAERAGMLGGMKANAPAAAFEAVLDTVRPHLTPREWDKLARALELTAGE
ncbi:hypothetical protein GCM10027034_34140 [Ramlibacter solisilvae]|uniref:Hemerythrin-like domain-containing protein n=1 Tax=Ramlibacter tataouinensis TaxID=94132 RepID=A0A127JXX1_9BURK|nr:hemerythrin domain-containing protein [Ramlibacter tataouinensis]AMO22912.1 hypothetical protein UC35_08440 [Ramlibacter tataouinensis]